MTSPRSTHIFAEHALQHLEPSPGLEDVNGYELGLDLIVDGLEHLSRQQRRSE